MNNETCSCLPMAIVDSAGFVVEFAHGSASSEDVSLQNDVSHFCFHTAKSKVKEQGAKSPT